MAAAPHDLGAPHRLLIPSRTGATCSAPAGHFIVGEKLRAGHANAAALARPGRYRTVAENLEIKQVIVGDGETRRRFVVCRNPLEARRDAARRERSHERIADELAALERKRTVEDRRDAEALL